MSSEKLQHDFFVGFLCFSKIFLKQCRCYFQKINMGLIICICFRYFLSYLVSHDVISLRLPRFICLCFPIVPSYSCYLSFTFSLIASVIHGTRHYVLIWGLEMNFSSASWIAPLKTSQFCSTELLCVSADVSVSRKFFI